MRQVTLRVGWDRRLTGAWAGVFLSCCLLASCTARTETPSAEAAFAARDPVEIRADIDPDSTIIGHLSLGAQVEVVGRHRSLVRVRLADDTEGWARESELVSADVRDRMERVRERTAGAPEQGGVLMITHKASAAKNGGCRDPFQLWKASAFDSRA